jgi:hypothetical protein
MALTPKNLSLKPGSYSPTLKHKLVLNPQTNNLTLGSLLLLYNPLEEYSLKHYIRNPPPKAT